MVFLKLVIGIILASLGFLGMIIAVMRYYLGKLQEVYYVPMDLSIGSLIALGIVSAIVFIGSIYLILHSSQ